MDGLDQSPKDTTQQPAESRNRASDGIKAKRPQVQLKRGTSLSGEGIEEAGLGRSMSNVDVEHLVKG